MNNIDVINTLSNAYFCVYHVELEKHVYSEIFAEDYMKDLIPSNGNTLDILYDVLENRILEQYEQELNRLKDYRYIVSELVNSNTFSVECKTRYIGWIRIVIMAAERDKAGNVTEVLVAGQNIDEQKTDELEMQQEMQAAYLEANRANASKTDFISKMSHDIRTPLNVIIGMTTIAKQYMNDKARVEYCIDQIADSGKHLLALINEVLDVSRIESGKIELVKNEFSLQSIADNVIALSRTMADLKEQTVNLDMSGIRNRLVVGDKTRVEEILSNLVTNAVKYTGEKGKIDITLSEKSIDDKFSEYTIVVKDNGIGMTKEFMTHLYEPFVREDDVVASNIEGTGLGMVITKKYTEAMNGTITVKSEKGKGSEFTVKIRLELQDEAEGKGFTNEKVTKLSELNYSGKRALMVEDNELNAEIAMEIIGLTGITFERARDGAEAVNMFTTSPYGYYDIIFMDVMMPVMDGYAATTAIRASERPDSSSVPIIAMTANAFASDIKAALLAGMNDHIAKPIDNEYLAKVLIKSFGGIK